MKTNFLAIKGEDIELIARFGVRFRRACASVTASARLFCGSLPRFGAVTTAVVAGISGVRTASPATLTSAQDFEAAKALGAQQSDVVWYRGVIGNTAYRGAGTLIRGRDYDWVLTAAHLISTPHGIINTTTMTLGDGTSYLSDQGNVTGASLIYVSPNYSGTGSIGSSDYAFIRLNNRISSPGIRFTLGLDPPSGTSVLLTGFGLPGTFSGGSLVNTGHVASFYGAFADVSFNNYSYDSAYYTGQNNSGVASPRDSGGPVKTFNSSSGQWENIGHITSGDGNSYTNFFSYSSADQNFHDFLSNTVRPVIPAPKPPSLAIYTSPTEVQISCADLIPAAEYRVMRSPTLSGWQEAHRFTASSVTDTWSEPLSPGGRMFYRLEWDE